MINFQWWCATKIWKLYKMLWFNLKYHKVLLRFHYEFVCSFVFEYFPLEPHYFCIHWNSWLWSPEYFCFIFFINYPVIIKQMCCIHCHSGNQRDKTKASLVTDIHFFENLTVVFSSSYIFICTLYLPFMPGIHMLCPWWWKKYSVCKWV